jgi:23S rRNA U2552 (ribose-2'-O)-methylase RlmE/FtsJ
MVKKVILMINDVDDALVHHTDVSDLLEKNELLYKIVTEYKNKITHYHNNKSWDKYKKLSNEYELIFTTPNTGCNISEYNPVSRSFFKLWEILHDFSNDFFPSNNPLKCLFLAEGPGGFAEALIKYRIEHGYTADEFHGITLKSNNDKNIPEWKIQKEVMKRIRVSYGEDNTGNLYNIRNIHHLSNSIGRNSIDLITADGGFDFSSDFNGQEELSFRLILCEIYATLELQKEGGTFVLKVFDMFNHHTLKLIQLLKMFYTTMYIIKPLTSRPANSEKYIVCVDYSVNEELKLKIGNLVQEYDEMSVAEFFTHIPFDSEILKNLVSYNIHYTIRQVFYIERTIQYINRFSCKPNDPDMNGIINDHIEKSKRWCEKYQIPHTTPNL